jgi:signal peptidase I
MANADKVPSTEVIPETTSPNRKPAPAAQSRAHAAKAEPRDSMREVVETVVFVVVLVLLLKSFVAEAFVIPTGSMATTLWGYQKLVECPKCHHTFPVNCSSEVEPDQWDKTTRIDSCTCPNCFYPIEFDREKIRPPCNTGDRVLVAKFLFDSGLMKPERLNVVVFKWPEEPQRRHVAINYIKRLIGLPGETIGIWYGKIYVLSPDKGPTYDDSHARPEDRWHKPFMHENDLRDLLEQDDSPFTILRKPPAQILALRRLVFDNDHQPNDLPKTWPTRWAGVDDGGAWKADQGNGFRHAAESGDALHWLRYRHILRPEPGVSNYPAQPELITDVMGYNSENVMGYNLWEGGHKIENRQPHQGRNWVGDLTLECEATVEQPQGELVLELSKGVDRFRARWDLSTGVCTLLRIADGKEIELESRPTPLNRKGTYQLRFANVDERLTLWVDNRLPFADTHKVDYSAPRRRGPTGNDLEPASIGVRGAGVSVKKLKLWRDTYYTVDASGADASLSGADDWSDPKSWESLRQLHGKTLYVQPDHYLCLGDNSPKSSDGRSWGLVPKRLLLGRAMLVYYPLYIPVWPLNSEVNRFGPIR